MSNWLARMFTIPRKEREKLAQIPGIHALGGAVQALAIAAAQHAVDEHVSDPEVAERLKDAIEAHVAHAIPVPAAAAHQSPMAQLAEAAVEGLIDAGIQKLTAPTPASPAPPWAAAHLAPGPTHPGPAG